MYSTRLASRYSRYLAWWTIPIRSVSQKRARTTYTDLHSTLGVRRGKSVGSFLRQDVARDHQPLNLAGSFVDLQDLRVAHQLFHRILLDVPVAAEHLDGVDRGLHRRVGAEGLGEA